MLGKRLIRQKSDTTLEDNPLFLSDAIFEYCENEMSFRYIMNVASLF